MGGNLRPRGGKRAHGDLCAGGPCDPAAASGIPPAAH